MNDELQVDFLILADFAEVIGGKLYLMGGAWDRITVQDPSAPMRFSVALGILIPWTATNQTHALRVTIEDADGAQQGVLMESSFVTGRPPELPPGATQRIVAAVNSLGSALPPAEYSISAAINGEVARRVSFRVIGAFAPPQAPA
jgi:hypothetical protein